MDTQAVTSRFYQRYLQNLKLGEKKHNEDSYGGNAKTIQAADPTAMLSAPQSGDGGGLAPNKQRRVQIMNKSDDFNPDTKLSDLPKYEKSKASRSFLRDSLSTHYLFETLEMDDLESIVDCMRYELVGAISVHFGGLYIFTTFIKC